MLIYRNDFDNEDKISEIYNEYKVTINFEDYENIIPMKKCACKLAIIDNILTSYATGFFCYIPSKERRVLITNSYAINEDFLNKNKELIIYIMDKEEEIEKIINLKSQRVKYINEDLEVAVIEIIDEDLIFNFIEVDEKILKNNKFLNEQVYNLQFPKGFHLKTYFGNIIKSISDKNLFIHDAGRIFGSTGLPIILTKENKIIGIHKGACKVLEMNKRIKI